MVVPDVLFSAMLEVCWNTGLLQLSPHVYESEMDFASVFM